MRHFHGASFVLGVVFTFSALVVLILISDHVLADAENSGKASVEIGGISLRLGMPKATLLEDLADKYKLQELNIPSGAKVDTWALDLPNGKKSECHWNDGTLSFENEKLVLVSKQWSQFCDDEAVWTFAHSLYMALMSGMQSRSGPATIICADRESTQLDFKQIYIEFPNGKKIDIFIPERGTEFQGAITEHMGIKY